jgi:hypothetical protein
MDQPRFKQDYDGSERKKTKRGDSGGGDDSGKEVDNNESFSS